MNVIDYIKTRDRTVGRNALAEIKAILADNRSGLVAGTFLHIGGRSDADPKEWAKVLRVRELSGDRLSEIQRQAWRDVLGEKS